MLPDQNLSRMVILWGNFVEFPMTFQQGTTNCRNEGIWKWSLPNNCIDIRGNYLNNESKSYTAIDEQHWKDLQIIEVVKQNINHNPGQVQVRGTQVSLKEFSKFEICLGLTLKDMKICCYEEKEESFEDENKFRSE